MPVVSFRGRSLDFLDASKEPGPPPTAGPFSLRIVSLSGPIRDRANRVTQPCHLERVAPKHDRRIGRIGDWADHLCPCPSILRWTLPHGARRSRLQKVAGQIGGLRGRRSRWGLVSKG